MGKPLSLAIRQRVVALVDKGLSCHEASRRSRISAASAVRIIQRKNRTGAAKAAPERRPRRRKLDAISDWIKGKVEAQYDIAMLELAEALGVEHGLSASPAMLTRHLIHCPTNH